LFFSLFALLILSLILPIMFAQELDTERCRDGCLMRPGLLVPAQDQEAEPKDQDAKLERRAGQLPIPEVLFIPTPHDIVVQMLELAGVREDDLLYDLGCGDGRILVTAVKMFSCRAVGFDIDPRRVKQSRHNLEKNLVEERAMVEEKDLFQVDLRLASVITLYLSPKFNAGLIPQLETLKPGSRIVSHQFDMEGVEPEKTVHYRSREDGRIHTLFLWTTPLKK
jgi:SAM-dependent methyltransferase